MGREAQLYGEGEMMAEWISVADRLPKEDGRYLCLYCLFPGKDNSPWHKILWFTNKAEENFDLAYNGEKHGMQMTQSGDPLRLIISPTGCLCPNHRKGE